MRTPKRASELSNLRRLAKSLRQSVSELDRSELNPQWPEDVEVKQKELLNIRNVADELERWADILGRGTK